MIDVKGKWALITGAGRGIGYLSAKFMAEQGCNLILHGRTLDSTAKILSEVKEIGVEAFPVCAEFSSLDEVEKMLSEIDSKGVDVDIVLNNAGYQIAYRTDYFKTPASDYTESFKINTIAPRYDCIPFHAEDDRARLRTYSQYDKRHSLRAAAGGIFREQGGT